MQTEGQIYKGWDVHAYTPDMLEISGRLQEWLRSMNLGDGVGREELQRTVEEIENAGGASFPSVSLSLAKLQAQWREDVKGNLDNEMGGINVSSLLVGLWRLSSGMGESAIGMFFETLDEIGGTCLQGQSHRLAALAIALLGSPSTEIGNS